MRCGFCKRPIEGETYVVNFQDTWTEENRTIQTCHSCFEAMKNNEWAQNRYAIVSSKFPSFKMLRYKPLRYYTKPQVNGLF